MSSPLLQRNHPWHHCGCDQNYQLPQIIMHMKSLTATDVDEEMMLRMNSKDDDQGWWFKNDDQKTHDDVEAGCPSYQNWISVLRGNMMRQPGMVTCLVELRCFIIYSKHSRIWNQCGLGHGEGQGITQQAVTFTGNIANIDQTFYIPDVWMKIFSDVWKIII